MKKLFIHIICLLFSTCIFAQVDSVLLDTIVLDEQANLWTENPGHLPEKIELEEGTVDALTMGSAVHIRSAGPGALVALAYRGMNSNQLNITWEGTRLNSPALGLTDLRLLPASANGEMQLIPSQSWKEGAGQGAGSLNYAYRSPKEKRFILSYGASSLLNQNLNIYLANRHSKFTHFNQVQLKQHQNKYYYEDPTQLSRPLKERENNDFQLLDFQGGVGLAYAGKFESKFRYWLQFADREVPNAVVAGQAQARQQDEVYRLLLINTRETEHNQQELKMAYLNETVHYQDPSNLLDNEHGTSSVQLNFRSSHRIGYYLLDLIGFQSIDRASSSYLSDSTKYRRQSELRVLNKFKLGDYYIAQANFGGIYSKQSKLVPQFKVALSMKRNVEIGVELGSHYRLPTLNDLYWNPGGNRNLMPETGLTSNLFISDDFTVGTKFKLWYSLQGYWNIINNWIQWAPVGTAAYWSPQNLKKVQAKGLELKVGEELKTGGIQMLAEQAVYYNRAESISAYTSSIILNKQLIYNPVWQFKNKLGLKLRQTRISLEHQYSSAVYYQSGTYKQLDPYQLFHLRYEYDYKAWTALIGVENLFNKNYELQKHFPQVGRAYQIKIIYKIN